MQRVRLLAQSKFSVFKGAIFSVGFVAWTRLADALNNRRLSNAATRTLKMLDAPAAQRKLAP